MDRIRGLEDWVKELTDQLLKLDSVKRIRLIGDLVDHWFFDSPYEFRGEINILIYVGDLSTLSLHEIEEDTAQVDPKQFVILPEHKMLSVTLLDIFEGIANLSESEYVQELVVLASQIPYTLKITCVALEMDLEELEYLFASLDYTSTVSSGDREDLRDGEDFGFQVEWIKEIGNEC